jgi:hypothetical protein
MAELENIQMNGRGTGTFISVPDEVHRTYTKVYFFGPFRITARLTEDDKLLDIVEVQINKDFRSMKQKIDTSASYDVSDLYEG